MAGPIESDSSVREVSGESKGPVGHWVAKILFLSGAFLFGVVALLVAGKMVSDWVDRDNAELAQHPYWTRAQTAKDVARIIDRIIALEADEDAERTGSARSLLLSHSGRIKEVPCDYNRQVRGHQQTHADLDR